MKHAKLWKRILHGGLTRHCMQKYVDHVQDSVIKSQIVVDNRSPDRFIHAPPSKMVSMPFDSFWAEGSIEELYGSDEEIGIASWGCLVESSKTPDGGWDLVLWPVIARMEGQPTLIARVTQRIASNGVPDKKWDAQVSDLVGQEESTRLSNICRYSLFDTLEMLACKNVFLSPHDNDPKDTRIATKRHGPSDTGYRYHTLVVRPAGSKPGTPGVEIGTMPRHVCRGHFAEYGPEYGKGLLFGKYAGRFFVPPHLKGKVENGIVEKDYVVNP